MKKTNLFKFLTDRRVIIAAVLAIGVIATVSAFASTGQQTVNGSLRVIAVENPAQRSSQEVFQVVKDDGATVPLELQEEPTTGQTGDAVSATGSRTSSGKLSVRNASNEAAFSVQASEPPPTESHNVGVVLFTFADNPYTPDYAPLVNSLFSGTGGNPSITQYFEQTSFGKVTLKGRDNPNVDVYDWVTIPGNGSDCSNQSFSWPSAADQAAATAGYDLSGYDHLLYIAAGATGNCQVWSEVGGRVSFYPDVPETYVAVHELGHNFGLQHANGYRCQNGGQPVPIGTQCSSLDYLDPFDVMGSAYQPAQFNNWNKARLGWVPPNQVQTVSRNGTYEIRPAEQADATLFRVPGPDNPTFGGLQVPEAKRYYYLEYRQPAGVDQVLAGSAAVNGVSLRLDRDYSLGPSPTNLIDSVASTESFDDAPLRPGETFTDSTGIRITTQSTDSQKAVVNITFASPPSPTPAPKPQTASASLNLVAKSGKKALKGVKIQLTCYTDPSKPYRKQGIGLGNGKQKVSGLQSPSSCVGKVTGTPKGYVAADGIKSIKLKAGGNNTLTFQFKPVKQKKK